MYNKIETVKFAKDNRGRKEKNNKVNWDKVSKEDMIQILEIWQKYGEITKEIPTDILKKIKEMKSCKKEVAKAFNMSKSTFYNLMNKEKPSEKEIQYAEEIKTLHNKYNQTYGKARIAIMLLKEYNITLSSRTVGRKLNKLNLFCKVRQKTRVRELKNTNFDAKDSVKRDYNDVNGRNIVATDVTYIPAPFDLKKYFNHIFLSIAIEHRTKRIINYNISTRNDNDLVISHIKDIKFNTSWIIHSNNGYQYTSNLYNEIIAQNNGIVSMSRVGNSLDNREAEYFFSILKSECLKFVNFNNITFDELKSIIDTFIQFYNSERIQSNLGWLSPNQYANLIA
ncbi:IS3 family transposase [Mycoplasmopsis verecunda]|uniref:IS3 family transposase n=1 Tax=Mycoplasmopsis verecunda TaxID=171291 RepID=UPI00298C0B33|nr:IS3 family transposase [Mycoplasmopsis verecunda]WPB54374.1 IS3 family transposase [Mycoplasmopsis verecunda]